MWKKTYNNEQTRIKKTITGIIGIVFLFYLVSCTLVEDFLDLEEGNAGPPSPPGEVRDLEVSDFKYEAGRGKFKVVWNAPTNTGISSNGNTSILTGYEVAYAEVVNEVSGVYTPVINKSTDTEHVFSSLDPGKKYDIRIRAMTAVGLGPASHISGWTPSLPGAVDSDLILFSLATTNTIWIEWTAPEPGKVGGKSPSSTPTSYKVEIVPDGGSEYTVVRNNYPGTDITVSDLNESTSYFARITAKNIWGEAVASISTTKGTTAKAEPTPPSAVENLKVDSFAYNEVVISWKAPTNMGTINGITPATLSNYVVKYKRTADSEFTEIDETGEGVRLATALTNTSTDATVIGLSDNTSYTFLVVAINSGSGVGLDADAPTVEQTTLLREPTPPSAVENLKVDSFAYNEVVISWEAPTNMGTTNGIVAATLSNYVVKYKRTADSEFTEIDENSVGVRLATALTNTNATVIGLSDNTSYTFLVVAVNSGSAVGLDADAPTVEQTTLLREATPPSAVENLKVDSFAYSEVAISWEAPTNMGTTDGTTVATLSNYVVKYKRTADSGFTEIDENSVGVRLATALTNTSTDATVFGLNDNTSYTFLVVAVNSGSAVGLDADAPTVEQTTLLREATPPSAVENLKVDSFTDTEVVISWEAPTNMGTTDGTTVATLSDYVVKYKRTADSEFVKIDETGEGVRLVTVLTGTTATVTGLDGNTSYTFLVVAVNSGSAVGLDADAPTVEQTTIPAPPGKFRLAQCTKATSVELAWDVSPGATSYKLYRDDAEIASITTNFYTNTGLTGGTAYTYKVQSCTTAGCSGDSDPLTITTINDQDKNLRNLVDSGRIPTDLTGYDEMSREIFSYYSSGVPLVAKHLKPGGSGDGSSFASISGNLKDVLDGITDAAADKVYAVFLAGGNYTNGDSVSMKNHVAIIGGVDECLVPSTTETALDGKGERRVLNNYNLDNTALLYKVTVTNGTVSDYGGGMYNLNSSPRLVRVTFSGNKSDIFGGGMLNTGGSSPRLVRVTFSENTAEISGGGIYNTFSSPSLDRVTFSGNKAGNGGGIYNNSSSPSLDRVTFSGNKADNGGGIYNFNSSPRLVGTTFTENKADNGGGIYNISSSPSLDGVTFTGNSADNGGGIYNNSSSPSLVGTTFSGNTADNGGGIANYSNSSPSLVRTTFTGNSADNGGGIYNFRSSPRLVGTTFSWNHATVYGGGMNNFDSFPSLEEVAFSGNTADSGGGGIYNTSSSPSLVGVTFSSNTAGRQGGGIYNTAESSPSLVGVTFSENTAGRQGGGIYNSSSSPSLVGVTFSGNHANNYGGGMYNNNDGQPGPRIINGIFWGNTASTDGPQFYFENYNDAQENLRIYNSIVEAGVGTLVSGTTNTNFNQGGFVSGGGLSSSVGTDPVVISFSNIIADDPRLGELADNGGSVLTHAIPSTSPAVNQGLYVRRKDGTFYYSKDGTDWYTNPDLSGDVAALPTDAEDVTTTDATGHTRTDRPDIGAYEAR